MQLDDSDKLPGTYDVMPTYTERFANGGLTFENAYTASPKCCPSRSGTSAGNGGCQVVGVDRPSAVGLERLICRIRAGSSCSALKIRHGRLVADVDDDTLEPSSECTS